MVKITSSHDAHHGKNITESQGLQEHSNKNSKKACAEITAS